MTEDQRHNPKLLWAITGGLIIVIIAVFIFQWMGDSDNTAPIETAPTTASVAKAVPAEATPLQEDEAALVTTHLRELQVARRYIRFFRNEHRRLLRNTSKLREIGLDILVNIGTWQEGNAYPTKNSWHYLFYDAVIRNVDFLDYQIEKIVDSHRDQENYRCPSLAMSHRFRF